MMRMDIATIIRSYEDNPDGAAVAICRMLEDTIGLWGNGWFDDDPDLVAALGIDPL